MEDDAPPGVEKAAITPKMAAAALWEEKLNGNGNPCDHDIHIIAIQLLIQYTSSCLYNITFRQVVSFVSQVSFHLFFPIDNNHSKHHLSP